METLRKLPEQPFWFRFVRKMQFFWKFWLSGLAGGLLVFKGLIGLDWGPSVASVFILMGVIASIIDSFPGLDRRSPNFLVHWGEPRTWFCGECQQTFLPELWLVCASNRLEPYYVAQCPFCRGGNTIWAASEDEQEEKRNEGNSSIKIRPEPACKVCGAPPLSMACHRYKERWAQQKKTL